MNNDLTTRLSRELHQQVDGWHDAPLTLESVRDRAGSIRRTRRLAAAGVTAAAVCAVAVPTALVGADLTGRSDRDVAPVDTPSEAVDSENPVAESALDVPYLEGRELVLPDGTRARLPERYQGGAVLGDDAFFGIRSDGGGNLFLDELDDQLQVAASVPLDSPGLAVNADSTAMTYSSGGELVIRWEGGQASAGQQGPVQPVRLVGGPDCTESTATCTVFFNPSGADPTPQVATNFGAANGLPGDPVAVRDATEDGRAAVTTEVDELAPSSCSAVVDLGTGRQAFETCDHALSHFSPGGEHLSATFGYSSGYGQGSLSILDATDGEEVLRYETADAETSIFDWTWEDADHLLAWEYSFTDGSWTVKRLGTDGTVEVALGPSTSGNDTEPAFIPLGLD
ncbi:MAG TPA: hypothetical protein VD814_06310 [Nocardioides sp.]|nr:hypothetical protein [Nocardioides sp.]